VRCLSHKSVPTNCIDLISTQHRRAASSSHWDCILLAI
jgi:hypothetical protein